MKKLSKRIMFLQKPPVEREILTPDLSHASR